MWRAPECIVRVVGGRSPAESAFLGTGMLVAPERVLTCNHVVREQDPWEGPTQVLIQNLWVETAAGRRVAVCQPPRLAPDLDLALLQLAEPLAADVPPFLSGLTEALVPTLQVLPLKVFGYQAPGVRTGSLIRYSINKWLVWGSSPDRGDTLSDWQLAGGLWEGLSGSPVLVAWKRQWAYVGTVYLGGTRSGTSRVIPADPVREFLAQQGLRNLPMIEATRLRARSARGLWW
ncbi:MAG: trypsin-like peptidase domain-containing protein, partial [Nitrospinae bacterium]|nr:trypsin-like peptidase domain-containing protein [Nitrospinota bacterium]